MSAMSERHRASVEMARAKVDHYEDLALKWQAGIQAARTYGMPLSDDVEGDVGLKIAICLEAWRCYLRELLAVGISVDLE